jgi:L-lysine exporter family protein LysE/ArgO
MTMSTPAVSLIRPALQGLLLAFGLIMPLGAQNTFLFTQGAVQRRWAKGLPAVVTAALCDTLLIAAAVSGVSVVVLHVGWVKAALGWIGVVFLGYLGWATWRRDPALDAPGEAVAAWPVRRQVAFAASVSLLNPHAILDTLGVIGTTALRYPAGPPRLAFAAACATVSWLWFTGLFTAGRLLGAANPSGSWLRWVNRVSALIMWGVALQLLLGNLAG